MSGFAGKVAYKPVALAAGATAHVVSTAVFRQVWRRIGREDTAPEVSDEERGWVEVLGAAALQGAILALITAAVSRAAATSVRRVTGSWPL
jgi:hypothetical protein